MEMTLLGEKVTGRASPWPGALVNRVVEDAPLDGHGKQLRPALAEGPHRRWP